MPSYKGNLLDTGLFIYSLIALQNTHSSLHLITPILWVLGLELFLPSSAAAAKSLQSCPTLCDPRDGSPPGSPVPGILQARVLEWGAIAFSLPSCGLCLNWAMPKPRISLFDPHRDNDLCIFQGFLLSKAPHQKREPRMCHVTGSRTVLLGAKPWGGEVGLEEGNSWQWQNQLHHLQGLLQNPKRGATCFNMIKNGKAVTEKH